MLNNLLLNPKEFEIDEIDGEQGVICCKRLIEKWTPELETEMLEAFIHLYYDEMYEQWGLMTRKKVKNIGRKLARQQVL